MSTAPTTIRRSLVLAALCLASATQAQTTTANDGVLQLLHDKGLVPVVQEAHKAMRQAQDFAVDLISSAMNFLGVPYKRGGQSADAGFDCSGFTRHIFASTLGLVLPHRAEQQARDQQLSSVERSELRPGDLVFFNTMKRAFSHVGIYMGEGKFIHAPRTGGQVRIEDMRQAYWSQRFNGARRAEVATVAAAAPAESAPVTLSQ
jgi:cell wall-associated NlpC family hydrolase